MFNDDQGMRKMALAITHYAYRNTALEEYHSKSTKMNMSFYKKIYNLVYKKLRTVKLLHKYINEYPFDIIQSKEECEELLQSVPEAYQFKFITYTQTIFELITFKFGSHWEPAQEIDCNLDGKSLANYVLSGRFLENCKSNAILDDATMYIINKDIHNRVYTLLINGYFISNLQAV